MEIELTNERLVELRDDCRRIAECHRNMRRAMRTMADAEEARAMCRKRATDYDDMAQAIEELIFVREHRL
jgi:hypothetical protein